MVLAAILILLLGALVTTNYLEEHAQRRYSETYALTETSSNNMLYTMRETLAYTDATDRYVAGAVPRRTVQVARALLAQRLSVTGDNGLTAAQTAPPSYRDALQAMDGEVANMPAGLLPPNGGRASRRSRCRRVRHSPMKLDGSWTAPPAESTPRPATATPPCCVAA